MAEGRAGRPCRGGGGHRRRVAPGASRSAEHAAVERGEHREASVDAVYQCVRSKYPGLEKCGVIPLADSAGTIEIVLDRDETNYSGASELHFDQNTGALVEADLFAEKNAGAQLRQMNYDLHAGVLWGFPTKLIAFFASLFAASLPVTGVLIWWPTWRRKRRAKKRRREKRAALAAGALESPAGDGAAEADTPVARPIALDPETGLPRGGTEGKARRQREDAPRWAER